MQPLNWTLLFVVRLFSWVGSFEKKEEEAAGKKLVYLLTRMVRVEAHLVPFSLFCLIRPSSNLEPLPSYSLRQCSQ